MYNTFLIYIQILIVRDVPTNGTGEMKTPESRVSTSFMAQYLGVGNPDYRNTVSSIRVKPILPPISLNKMHQQAFAQEISNKKETKTRVYDEIDFDDRKYLPNYCIYHPLPNHVHFNNSHTRNTENQGMQVNDDFSKVIRWKSKARYIALIIKLFLKHFVKFYCRV